jgi:hypothetical protein
MLKQKLIIIIVIVILFLIISVNVKAETNCNLDSECESTEFCDFQNCNEDAGICVKKLDSSLCDTPEYGLGGPVCGCDKNTYENDCYRREAGVSKNYAGQCNRQISNYYCDEQKNCPDGLECIKFPGIGTRCAESHPCGYFNCSAIVENSVCAVKEAIFNIPKEVVCKGDCSSNNDCAENEFCDYYPEPGDFEIGECVKIPTTCSSTISPVCGSNGKTYQNDCLRKKVQVPKNYDGSCIDEISNRSCGVEDMNKNTCDFIGSCVDFPGIGRRCANVDNFSYYPCPEGFERIIFPMYPWKLTCRKNGCFDNEDCGSTEYAEYNCLLQEQGEDSPITNKGCLSNISGVCMLKQDCDDYYKPICGCDGITYKNICAVMEAGAVKKYDGECKNGTEITDIVCDASTSCPEGLNLRCYNFPDLGMRCAKPNPCAYYQCPENTECRLTASYPARVVCNGKCKGVGCERGIIYDVEKETTKITAIIKSDKIEATEVTLYSGPGSKGTLETPTVSAEVSKDVDIVIKESRLIMRTSTGEKFINILPEDAITISGTTNIAKTKVELKEESQKPIYYVKGTKQTKILFIIPINLPIETKVDAETGKIISVKKTWWSFLVK